MAIREGFNNEPMGPYFSRRAFMGGALTPEQQQQAQQQAMQQARMQQRQQRYNQQFQKELETLRMELGKEYAQATGEPLPEGTSLEQAGELTGRAVGQKQRQNRKRQATLNYVQAFGERPDESMTIDDIHEALAQGSYQSKQYEYRLEQAKKERKRSSIQDAAERYQDIYEQEFGGPPEGGWNEIDSEQELDALEEFVTDQVKRKRQQEDRQPEEGELTERQQTAYDTAVDRVQTLEKQKQQATGDLGLGEWSPQQERRLKAARRRANALHSKLGLPGEPTFSEPSGSGQGGSSTGQQQSPQGQATGQPTQTGVQPSLSPEERDTLAQKPGNTWTQQDLEKVFPQLTGTGTSGPAGPRGAQTSGQPVPYDELRTKIAQAQRANIPNPIQFVRDHYSGQSNTP